MKTEKYNDQDCIYETWCLSCEEVEEKKKIEEETDDEVETYECLKYVNATRAFYNIYSFPIQERFSAVLTLPVHEENKQTAVFVPGSEAKRAENPPVSPLIAYFN